MKEKLGISTEQSNGCQKVKGYVSDSALAAAGNYLVTLETGKPAIDITAKSVGAALLATGAIRLSVAVRRDSHELRKPDAVSSVVMAEAMPPVGTLIPYRMPDIAISQELPVGSLL